MLAVSVASLWLGASAPVSAEPVDAAQTEASHRAPVLTGELSSGFFAGHPDGRGTASVAPRLELGIRARPSVELGINFGMATLHQAPPPGSNDARREASPGNMGFGLKFIRERNESRYSKLYVGFGFGIPTGFAEADRERQALSYAVATAGGWNAWEWEPATMSIVVPFGGRVQVLRRIVLGADAGVAGMFASSSDSGPHGVGAQVAGQARYVLPWFGLGLRLQGSYNGRNEVDSTQAAVTPFVDTGLCRRSAERRIQGVMSDVSHPCPVRLSAAVHINLDAPYGFVGDGQQIWGGQVALGWAVF